MNSRQQAKASGAVHYESVRPCRNGHLTLRYTSTGACVACAKAARAATDEALRLQLKDANVDAMFARRTAREAAQTASRSPRPSPAFEAEFDAYIDDCWRRYRDAEAKAMRLRAKVLHKPPASVPSRLVFKGQRVRSELAFANHLARRRRVEREAQRRAFWKAKDAEPSKAFTTDKLKVRSPRV